MNRMRAFRRSLISGFNKMTITRPCMRRQDSIRTRLSPAAHHATPVTRALERQGLLLRDDETPSLDLEPDDGFDNSSAPPSTTASPPAPRRAQGPDPAHTVASNPPADNPLHRSALGILPPCLPSNGGVGGRHPPPSP